VSQRRRVHRRLGLACAGLLAVTAGLLAVPALHVAPASAATLRVVGLGDSVVSGSRCDCEPFVGRYAELLQSQTGTGVQSTNEGRPGLTAGQLADLLHPGTPVADEVARADVVLVTVGANDLQPALDAWQAGGCAASCQAEQVSAMRSNLRLALGRLAALTAPRRPEVLVTTYWNVFADGQVARRASGEAYLAWSDAITRAANTAICATAHQVGDRCVDLYRPFKDDGTTDPTPLLADDGDHPDAKGHDVIAHALAATPPPVRASAGGSG
jgi:lysophospholipase L1-like esterase